MRAAFEYAMLIHKANEQITLDYKTIKDLDTMQDEISDGQGFWHSSTYAMWEMLEHLACNCERSIKRHQKRLAVYYSKI